MVIKFDKNRFGHHNTEYKSVICRRDEAPFIGALNGRSSLNFHLNAVSHLNTTLQYFLKIKPILLVTKVIYVHYRNLKITEKLNERREKGRISRSH